MVGGAFSRPLYPDEVLIPRIIGLTRGPVRIGKGFTSNPSETTFLRNICQTDPGIQYLGKRLMEGIDKFIFCTTRNGSKMSS